MFKFAKFALVCMLLASTEAALADDVYRCGKVYQDSPCAGGNSRPMNEKPFKPSVNQHTTKSTTSGESKPFAKPKKLLSKRKPVAVPEPTDLQVETTQNSAPANNATAAAQAVLAPAENPTPTENTASAASRAPAKVVDKPAETQAAQKMAEKEVVADEQGVCSSLKAGLKNISNQKAKGGGAATMKDLNQQQRNLEGAMHSAGC